ncbi:hypothetical protein PPERSA_05705 [Pseudocohnilembus persalinus]|uniref:Transmembrane protein n=1 Tax=Pseudocohnilembus persalinus TaxID=266149 RepID=A0A0V0QLY5_PSEPJ|nr:hypothetical protein PPERSA_05705 [Pseudocohnilembus persalinus]|eukprot:KRX03347.1 hypothetical protein PPERSA_05705 [Pseudocohnilembus persalinus]
MFAPIAQIITTLITTFVLIKSSAQKTIFQSLGNFFYNLKSLFLIFSEDKNSSSSQFLLNSINDINAKNFQEQYQGSDDINEDEEQSVYQNSLYNNTSIKMNSKFGPKNLHKLEQNFAYKKQISDFNKNCEIDDKNNHFQTFMKNLQQLNKSFFSPLIFQKQKVSENSNIQTENTNFCTSKQKNFDIYQTSINVNQNKQQRKLNNNKQNFIQLQQNQNKFYDGIKIKKKMALDTCDTQLDAYNHFNLVLMNNQNLRRKYINEKFLKNQQKLVLNCTSLKCPCMKKKVSCSQNNKITFKQTQLSVVFEEVAY